MFKRFGYKQRTYGVEARIGKTETVASHIGRKISSNKKCGSTSSTSTTEDSAVFICNPTLDGKFLTLQSQSTMEMNIGEVNVFVRGQPRLKNWIAINPWTPNPFFPADELKGDLSRATCSDSSMYHPSWNCMAALEGPSSFAPLGFTTNMHTNSMKVDFGKEVHLSKIVFLQRISKTATTNVRLDTASAWRWLFCFYS